MKPRDRRRFAENREVIRAMRPPRQMAASEDFRERVMRAIQEEETRTAGLLRWRNWPRWAMVGAAAALLLLLIPMLPWSHDGQPSPAKLLAQSVQAMNGVRTVHMTGRMRTIAGDNFELIGKDYDFVPLEIWREYSKPPRWRVEKPGRVVVMDGHSSLLYISKINTAWRGTPGAGFIEWMRPLLDPQSLLEEEQAAAREGGTVMETQGVRTLTVRRKAQGDFTNAWARNKSIQESDNTCIYRFDSASRRLEGVQVNITVDGREVTVLELTGFRYNETFPDSLFAVQLPADVTWEGEALKPQTVRFNGPQDVARFFFQAMADEDWDRFLEVYSGTRVREDLKRAYGGIQILSIGEPFRSGIVPGYFVPYEIKFRGGEVKKFNLHARNDGREQRWRVDGGY